MSVLSRLKRKTASDPPRILIYGPPGMGKTSLAAEFPAAVFLQVEDGTPAGIEIDTFGTLHSFAEVMENITGLYTDEHSFQTVVIDSLDRLEPLVWAATCERNRWADIEAPGYGKGYLATDTEWRDLIDACSALRRDRGMNIVFIAHSTVTSVNDPMTVEYSRYDIRLHKRALALFQDEVDAILFLNQDVSITKDDPKAKDSRSRAVGGGNRYIYTSPRPAFVAKNRYDIPDKLLYNRGAGFTALSQYFPNQPTNTKAA